MTKDELLASMRSERKRIDAAVASVDDERRAQPAFDGGWSVKDVLAHISFWERTCTRWLEAVARDETPSRPEVSDVNATNAAAYQSAKALSLTDVLAESRASYDAIVHATAALSEADLADERRFGFPLWRMIDGNSGEHYREHAEQIETWLAGAATA